MPTRSPRLLVIIAGTLLSGGVIMSGCDQGDPGVSVVRETTSKLAERTDGSGVTPALTADKRKSFFQRDVIDALKPHLASNNPGVAAAANLLSARATAALADDSAMQAAEGEAAALRKLGVLRVSLDVWSQQNNRATISEGYQPEADLAAIDKQAGEIDAAVGQANVAERSAAERVIAIQKRADELLAQAKAKREQAAQIKQRLAAVSATEGLALLKQSAAVGRDADGLEVQAAGVREEAIKLQPAVDDAKRAIELLTARRENLKASKAAVLARAESGRVNAVEARKVADGAGADAARLAMEIVKDRAENIAPAVEAAVKGYRAAEGLAKSKGASPDPAAKASVASYQQAMGHVLLAQARGQESLIAALKMAVDVRPPLKAQAELAKELKAQEDLFTETLKAAKESFSSAQASFQSSGGKGEAVEKVAKLTGLLDKVIGKQATLSAEPGDEPKEGQSPEAKPEEGGKPAGAGEAGGGSGAASADEAGIRKTAGEFAAALKAGNVDQALGYYNAQTDEQGKAMEAVVIPMLNILALDTVCKDKVGGGLDEVTAGTPAGMMMPMLLAGLRSMQASGPDDEVKVTAPGKGELRQAGAPMPLNFEKVGDRWLIAVPDASKMPGGAAGGPAGGAMVRDLGQICGELAGEVKSGKLKTKQEVAAALQAKLAPLMEKMMPPGTRPKPPGG